MKKNRYRDQKFNQIENEVRMMRYDHLTGLPTINYFFDLADEAHKEFLEEGVRLCMLYFDMNGMKAFNQRYGYSEGDILIKAVGDLMAGYFGSENCCRVSADRFTAFDYFDGIKEKLKKFLLDFKKVNGGKNLPIRIGVYGGDGMEDVSVATACDRAKIACDSCGDVFESTIVFFDRVMLNKFESRRYVLENFERALESGFIKVFYQPIIRASNGRVCSEEALVRWDDPEKGMLNPLDFIPILEDSKISYKLDLYVVEKVIEKLKEQGKGGLYIVPNSINLSRTDFYSCDIVEEIRKRVDDSGLDRSKIIIEITESVILDDIDFMMVQVNRFRELGFSVWMDDFGCGYSSPDVLQQIHFDVLKLDKAFIDNITKSEGSRVIITELVRLANGLGSETVAEGIETAEEVEFLKEIGCTRLQGFFYCKPVSLEDIFERNRKGIQIGFENPAESEYYTILGNINLYDMSLAASDDDDGSLGNYFDTLPMFIVEAGDDEIKLTRGNKSYREFMRRHYPDLLGRGKVPYSNSNSGLGSDFTNSILQCKKDEKRIVVDVKNRKGDIIHLFIRKITTNPVTGVVALGIVILGYVDNDSELRHKEALERIKQERRTYARITALSGDFICIYTVDPVTNHYLGFSVTEGYKTLGISSEGDDFFKKSLENGAKVVYLEDMELYMDSFNKENVMKEIDDKGVYSLNYRLMLDGVPRYVCLKAAIIDEEDGPQLIVGILDTDNQVKKEQEYALKLTAARDIANLDALTGVKNKHAYVDSEIQLDALIEEGNVPEFAIVVFDLNGLKVINDTMGHQAGDAFIKAGCQRICTTFQHSPVFRIGGDEFMVIAQGLDYKNINRLMKKFEEENLENIKNGGVVIAAGMSRFHNDRHVSDVFERADAKMYANKKYLKEK